MCRPSISSYRNHKPAQRAACCQSKLAASEMRKQLNILMQEIPRIGNYLKSLYGIKG